jgi:hypothetical protein
MIEDNKTDKGSTKGTTLGILKSKNLPIMNRSKSFPASSDINSQTT